MSLCCVYRLPHPEKDVLLLMAAFRIFHSKDMSWYNDLVGVWGRRHIIAKIRIALQRFKRRATKTNRTHGSETTYHGYVALT